MALASGTRLGVYEILIPLGAGGMGEVYRARDTKLNRDVALKILPEAFTLDGDRIARFRREAQVLASLNHPNIAAIYGFEDSGSTHALVLELVEGPTLADRIAKGSIPLHEALPIAKQIAEALEAAHEQGVIHRDLKPANIKLRTDGTVKVLDFGIAKAIAGSGDGGQEDQFDRSGRLQPDLTASPTISTPAMTQAGLVMGTAAYMSPEQARGSLVDRRSDVWAFGAVLYEMLVGRRPFDGSTVSETLAQVLEREPDLTRLPANTPAAIGQLVRRCLAKDRKERLQHVGDARVEITEALTAPVSEVPKAELTTSRSSGWRRAFPSVAAALTATLVTGVIVWISRADPPARTSARFTVATLPVGYLLLSDHPDVAISPDGTRIVYGSSNPAPLERLLYLRPVNQIEATPIRGTEGGSYPVFSPNGESIAFFDEANSAMKRVSVLGGPAANVTRLSGRLVAMSWASDDVIVFSTSESHGLRRVPAGGGVSQPLTTENSAQTLHTWPQGLPGGTGVLFTVWTRPASTERVQGSGRIAHVSLATGQVIDLGPGSHPQYSPTGHVIYSADGALWAVGFDPHRPAFKGDPIPVVQGVQPKQFGGANFSVSGNGSLVYVSGSRAALERTLVWVDRNGSEEALGLPPAEYHYPHLSPDGKRVVVSIGATTGGDLWVFDISRLTSLRVTTSPTEVEFPFWTPDGQRLVFGTDFGPRRGLWTTTADGAGQPEPLADVEGAVFVDPQGWSIDGKTLVFGYSSGTGNLDFGIGVLSLETRTWKPLVQTAANEHTASLSPARDWIAYVSDETGRGEVYVERFPTRGNRQSVSADGGDDPMWSPTGRELYYRRSIDGAMMAVPVATTPTFSAGTPKALFKGHYFAAGGHYYDVAPGGQRFLMLKDRESTGASVLPIILIENWQEELTQRVQTK